MVTSLNRIKYAVISEALESEVECGDQYFIRELDDIILIAVADGLGHGKEAAHAAKKAMQVLNTHANESIKTLFGLCHQALLDTRGAAITIVQIDLSCRLTYMSIGNVMGVFWRLDTFGKLTREPLFLEGGIVGYRYPPSINIKEMPMAPGDIFILATDGISTLFENEPAKLEAPDKIAKYIFNTYRNKKDDGLVFVAQLL